MITDRTLADVEYARANPTSEEDLKGAYNNTDLNRVEEKVEEIYNILKEYSYDAKITEIKKDWLKSDFFSPSDGARYLNNLRKLVSSYVVMDSTPEVPQTMASLTYEDANNIEKILVDIETLIYGMEQLFIHSGVANSGQPRIWQQRYRRKYLLTVHTDFIDSNGEEFITSESQTLRVKE